MSLRYENSLTWHDFRVNASCADGYIGTAVVQMCNKSGEPYVVSGCKPLKCLCSANETQADTRRSFRWIYASLTKVHWAIGSAPSISASCRCLNNILLWAVPLDLGTYFWHVEGISTWEPQNIFVFIFWIIMAVTWEFPHFFWFAKPHFQPLGLWPCRLQIVQLWQVHSLLPGEAKLQCGRQLPWAQRRSSQGEDRCRACYMFHA